MVTIKAVGDIALAGKMIRTSAEEQSGYLLKFARTALNESDVLIANFEFPFVDQGFTAGGNHRQKFIANPASAVELENIDWTIFTIANNHIMDSGCAGLATTQKILNRYARAVIGAGENLDEAAQPYQFEVRGIRFAALACCKSGPYDAAKKKTGVNPINIKYLQNQIRLLKKSGVDHIILSCHWGTEYSSYPSPDDARFAKQLIDGGVSLIIGHHPHTLQGIDRYKNGVIAYSLGNFITDTTLDAAPKQEAWIKSHWGGILSVGFSKNEVLSYTFEPTLINANMRTLFPASSEKLKIEKHMQEISSNIVSDDFYGSAVSNIFAREIQAWKIRFQTHGLLAFVQLIKAVKVRHIKMLAGFLKNKVLAAMRQA